MSKIDPTDIVGKVYKDIRVDSYIGLKFSGNRNRHFYSCTCIHKDIFGNICGKKIEIERYAITYETICSCGNHTDLYNPYDIIGQTINFLHIDKYIRKEGPVKHFYECTCVNTDDNGNICGNKTIVARYAILNGSTKSCGCLAKRIDVNDIVGKQFGFLKVESYNGYNNGYHSYNCVCLNKDKNNKICGKRTIVARENLISGKSNSCGCFRSIITSLRATNIDPNDIVGKEFNFIHINSYNGITNGNRHMYNCTCINKNKDGLICNNKFIAERNHILSGHTKSCGCYMIQKSITHGLSKHPLYHTWCGMCDRCDNPNNYSYSDYGGRGISVCEEWDNKETGLQNFINDMYPQYLEFKENNPGVLPSIDRIEVDGNYEYSNCRYTGPKEQANNRRNSKNKKA